MRRVNVPEKGGLVNTGERSNIGPCCCRQVPGKLSGFSASPGHLAMPAK